MSPPSYKEQFFIRIALFLLFEVVGLFGRGKDELEKVGELTSCILQKSLAYMNLI